MYRQIIKPEKKEDLIVQLPEEFLGKEIEIEANEVKEKDGPEKPRHEILLEVFKHWDSMKVNTKGYKFNRDEANER